MNAHRANCDDPTWAARRPWSVRAMSGRGVCRMRRRARVRWNRRYGDHGGQTPDDASGRRNRNVPRGRAPLFLDDRGGRPSFTAKSIYAHTRVDDDHKWRAPAEAAAAGIARRAHELATDDQRRGESERAREWEEGIKRDEDKSVQERDLARENHGGGGGGRGDGTRVRLLQYRRRPSVRARKRIPVLLAGETVYIYRMAALYVAEKGSAGVPWRCVPRTRRRRHQHIRSKVRAPPITGTSRRPATIATSNHRGGVQ